MTVGLGYLFVANSIKSLVYFGPNSIPEVYRCLLISST